MPKTHTVAQGETLTRIARQYKYSSWKKIYEHPDNAEFRTLRENPDIIFPGDKIIIPDIEPKKMSARAGKSYTFCIKKEKEMLLLNIGAGLETPLEGKRAVLKAGGQKVSALLDKDGLLEVELPDEYEPNGSVELFLDENSDQPSHIFELELGTLDPIEELSGIQARCNALGFDCGVVDGIMGSKTREGVEEFQEAYELEVDGEPGPKTQAKLKEVYGC